MLVADHRLRGAAGQVTAVDNDAHADTYTDVVLPQVEQRPDGHLPADVFLDLPADAVAGSLAGSSFPPGSSHSSRSLRKSSTRLSLSTSRAARWTGA